MLPADFRTVTKDAAAIRPQRCFREVQERMARIQERLDSGEPFRAIYGGASD